MFVEDGFCEYQSIEQFLEEREDLKKVSGVFVVAFYEITDVEFTNMDLVIANPISPSKLTKYYNSSDKKHLLLASTESLYDAIDSFFNSNVGCSKESFVPKSSKVIWQIKDISNLHVAYLEIEKASEKKEELLEKFDVKPIGNKTFNDNDAIPSWSGFNYQGKGIILRGIQRINEAIEQTNDIEQSIQLVKNMYIEIELQEDFVLYEGNLPIEFVQVKAMLASKSYSNYSTAITKLIDHRNDSINKFAVCRLMSAVEITPWRQTEVELFLYEENVLTLSSIPEAIKSEISKFILSIGLVADEYKVNNLYQLVCGRLDQRTHNIHLKVDGYKFDLYDDIWAILCDSYDSIVANSFYEVKEQLYLSIPKDIENIQSEMCESCRRRHKYYDCDSCVVNELKNDLASIDLFKYAQYLRPDKEINNSLDEIKAISDIFSENSMRGLHNQFLYVDIYNYGKKNHYHYIDLEKDDERVILPTVLNFSDTNDEYPISIALGNIRNNMEIKADIDKKALTVTGSSYFDSKNIINSNISNFQEEKKELMTEYWDGKEDKTTIVEGVDVTLMDKIVMINKLKEKSDKVER